MAEQQPSSSSETSDEEVEQFSNNLDNMETSDNVLLDSYASSSDSDLDSDIPQRSVYSILKPFHIPGTGGSQTEPEVQFERGPDNEVEVLEEANTAEHTIQTEDAETSLETANQTEGPADKSECLEFHEKQQFSSYPLPLQDSSPKANMAERKQSNSEVFQESLVKPVPPPKPPKPNGNIKGVGQKVFDSKGNESEWTYTGSSAKDMYQDTQFYSKDDKLARSMESPENEGINPADNSEIRFSKNSETKDHQQYYSEETEEIFYIADEITAHATAQNGEDEQTMECGTDEDSRRNHNDIITDSLIADINESSENEVEFKTSLIGMESFAIIDEYDGNDETFSTPKENLSDMDDNENVEKESNYSVLQLDQAKINALQSAANALEAFIENQDNVQRAGSMSTGSSTNGTSFVVIGKGSLHDSQHGYTSISSSLSESELQNTDESYGKTIDTPLDRSDNYLPIKDRIKRFEGIPRDQLCQKDMALANDKSNDGERIEVREKTCFNASGDNGVIESIQQEDENSDTAKEMPTDGQCQNNIQTKDNVQKEASSDNDHNIINIQPPVPKSDIDLQSLESLAQDHKQEETKLSECQPPVPPKSEAVLQSLRSLNQELHLEHDTDLSSLDRHNDSEMIGFAKEENDPNAMQHDTQQHRTEIGYSSMSKYQANPYGSENQGNFSPYTPGYFPGSPPYVYDPETFQRLMKDPQYWLYMNQQFYYQQQFQYMRAYGQGPSMGQDLRTDPIFDEAETTNDIQRESSVPSTVSITANMTDHSFSADEVIVNESLERHDGKQSGCANLDASTTAKLEGADDNSIETQLRPKSSSTLLIAFIAVFHNMLKYDAYSENV